MDPRPVYIVWIDSQTDHGWQEADKKSEDPIIRTMGFLVNETPGKKGMYRVAHSEDGNYVNGTIDIPKVCVIEFYEIEWRD